MVLSLLLEHICRLRQENVISRVNRLQAGQLGGLNPSRGKRFSSSAKCAEWFWGPCILPFNGYWNSCWRYNDQYIKLIIHFRLVLRLKVSVAIPLFALYAFMAWRETAFLLLCF